MNDKHYLHHLRLAVEKVGSQARLAEKIGVVQQHISKLFSGERRITAELAVAIEAATDGAVRRHELRPDLWQPPFITQDGNRIERNAFEQ